MRIHHLNCISTCPLGGHWMDGRSGKGLLERGHLTCHCLLIETANSLVLLDTGFGLNDVRDPRSRLSRFFLGMLKPEFREEMTAYRQIERIGLNPRDVRHIVMTHLDFDHAGGLDDFPEATVHLLHDERVHAEAQRTWLDRQRFRPQQWSTRKNWMTYSPESGDQWFGLERVSTLKGLPPEIVMIPLIGHTLGHCGIAVREFLGWKLLAGDAYFNHQEMYVHPRCTPGLRLYQWMLEKNRRMRLFNQERLRDLRATNGGEISIFCSHDLAEFERHSGHSASIPADKILDSVA